MKILLKESKLKNLLKDRFGLDLTGKITDVYEYSQIDEEFWNSMSPGFFKEQIKIYGPVFLIDLGKKKYVLFKRRGEWFILENGGSYEFYDYEFKEILGIEGIPISIDELIDLYI
jgi:hypothetical protein